MNIQNEMSTIVNEFILRRINTVNADVRVGIETTREEWDEICKQKSLSTNRNTSK